MMRKMIAIAVVLVLCISLSVPAFATTSAKSDYTDGRNKIYVTATLDVGKRVAYADTSIDDGISGLTLVTTITYHYINGQTGHQQAYSSTGIDHATAGFSGSGEGLYGESQHSARGGSTFGNWDCSLSATAS